MPREHPEGGSYFFDVIAWEDFQGNRHGVHYPGPEYEGPIRLPDDITQVYGLKIYYHDPANPEDQGMFWSYGHYGEWDNWEDFFDYVGGQMADHGLDLAA